MYKEASRVLEQIGTLPPASEEALQSLAKYFEATFGASVPTDYIDFLHVSNGGIGQGPDLFVVIAGAEDVMLKEKGYGQDDLERDLFLIGGDGCGNTLGIDTRSKDAESMIYLMFDPVGLSSLDDADAVSVRESSFLRLLAGLSDYYTRIGQPKTGGL